MPWPTINGESKASRVVAVLEQGPATSSEVAAALDIKATLACAHLAELRRQGRVKREPYHDPDRRRRARWLWSLGNGKRSTARERIAELEAALDGMVAIARDSSGVCGYHLNGEPALWDEFPEVAEAVRVLEHRWTGPA